ncbi:AMP-binding protein, partial [Streptomyces sp. NPDC060048]|uniref:AMP-binding protein n=1 Tax=unclassified Streptomyces TaxID=2593676 RepID=UPI00368F548A
MNRSIPEQCPAERLVDRFEAWVDRAPEAVALVEAGCETTYGELEARANQLAGFLVSRGVGPEVVVGVCGTTGADSVVALLGILKAEGVYLPLDTRNPRERLEHMVRSSRAHLVLTGPAGPAGGEDTEAFGPLTLRWEEHRADIDARPATRPRRTAHPDALMYIVYTSGSTGTPKGIEVPHRTLENAVGWLDAGAAGPSVCLQFASAGFDVSLLEVMGSLSSGSRLVIAGEDVRGEPALLLRLMARYEVERLYLSPSLLQQLAVAAGGLTEPLPAPGLSKLREILVSGEALRLTPDVRAFLDTLDGVLLENQYGPSETHHA